MPVTTTDKVIITGRGSLQSDGRYDFSGTVTEVKGRVAQVDKDIYTANGAVRIYDYQIWLPSWVEIEGGDKLTIGDVVTKVVKKYTGTDIDGNTDHIKVWVKRFGT